MSKGRYYPKGPKAQQRGPQEVLRQLQEAQKRMEEIQASLAEETVEHSAGGGMVRAVADGQQNLKSLAIDPQVVDPEDVGMLEDLVIAAVNGALEKSRELASERLGGLAGGLPIPGL